MWLVPGFVVSLNTFPWLPPLFLFLGGAEPPRFFGGGGFFEKTEKVFLGFPEKKTNIVVCAELIEQCHIQFFSENLNRVFLGLG